MKKKTIKYQILVAGIVVHETTIKWAHRIRVAEMKAKGMQLTTNKVPTYIKF